MHPAIRYSHFCSRSTLIPRYLSINRLPVRYISNMSTESSTPATTAPATPSASTPTQMASEPPKYRFIDIGINLTDDMYRGHYYGKKVHDEDLKHVITRAQEIGCQKFMITGSDLDESKKAIQIAEKFPGLCYTTVGVHPCSATTFDKYPEGPTALLEALKELALEQKGAGLAVAFGEIGLDYDRLHYTPKDVQLKYFEAQLDLAVEIQLPLFLHSRAATEDFERLLKPYLEKLPKRGLVHSFTGSLEEMKSLVNLGLDIGVNGCSLKTEENLAVVKEIPLERMQIETDGPWCEIRPSHASHKLLVDFGETGVVLPKAVKKEKWHRQLMVKGRNEPCTIIQVAHVVAKVKGISIEEVCEAAWRNSVQMFGLGVELI